MKWLCTGLLLFMMSRSTAQEQTEEELENAITTSQSAADQLPDFLEQHRNRFHINRVTAEELASTGLLEKRHIDAFMDHVSRYGPFISLMELQSITGWEPTTVRRILPLLYYTAELPLVPEMKQRLREGAHRLLIRTGGSSRWNSEKDTTMGSGVRYLFNYRFQFEQFFRIGCTLEKDAGEKRWNDFSSGYIALRKKGWIQTLILGDFQVNMGQGLVHWQGYAVGRGASLLSAFRQDQVFVPHTGSDENRFHRGLAVAIKKGKMEAAFFGGRLNIDARRDSSARDNSEIISSFHVSGLHRSAGEVRDRKSIVKNSAGGRFRFTHPAGAIALNAVVHQFELPVVKEKRVYNAYAISGSMWWNASLDHRLMTQWGLLFGEMAVDKQGDWSLFSHWIKSIDPKLDISLGYRNMSPKYRAVESNCFSDNGEAGNEKGLFFSLVYQPAKGHQWDFFTDRFKKPWPSFSVDGSETVQSWGVQYTWRPNKKSSVQLRFQQQGNQSRFRLHLIVIPAEQVELRMRNELVIIRQTPSLPEIGMLGYGEVIWRELVKGLTISVRCTAFETGSYATRIYAYERDVLGQFLVPAHYGKGTRAYALATYGFGKGIKFQAKWIMHRYREWRMQLICPLG